MNYKILLGNICSERIINIIFAKQTNSKRCISAWYNSHTLFFIRFFGELGSVKNVRDGFLYLTKQHEGRTVFFRRIKPQEY